MTSPPTSVPGVPVIENDPHILWRSCLSAVWLGFPSPVWPTLSHLLLSIKRGSYHHDFFPSFHPCWQEWDCDLLPWELLLVRDITKNVQPVCVFIGLLQPELWLHKFGPLIWPDTGGLTFLFIHHEAYFISSHFCFNNMPHLFLLPLPVNYACVKADSSL